MSILSAVLTLVLLTFQAIECYSLGGSVYTRWCRKNCPTTATLIYSGYVEGSHYTHRGGAAGPLCLPRNPQWGRHNRRMEASRGHIYGAEYEIGDAVVHNHDVPCAVCKTHSGKSVIIIPVKICQL